MGFIRPPALAGTWYPGEAGALRDHIGAMLAAAPTATQAIPKAIIAPHAGTAYSGPIAAQIYARLLPARHIIKRVLIMGPSHRIAFRGIAGPTAEAFQTPLGAIPIDQEALKRVYGLPNVGVLDRAHEQEHCIEIELPFLQMVLDDFALVPLVMGEATAEQTAAIFGALWGGPETLIVASSDLSHYLDYDAACAKDARTAEAIERLDPGALTPDDACGRTAIAGLLLIARQLGMAAERVDMRNSGDTAGPRDRVVGYGAWGFHEPAGPEAEIRRQGAFMLGLARNTIATALAGGQPTIPDPRTLAPVLANNGACFVTLKRGGQLRGCIGSATAWRPLALDLAENALAAAFKDPRFPALTPAEQEGLELSVSVLTPPRPMNIASEADLLAQLRPQVDGLIITDGERRSLFLPSVWEMLPNPVDFLTQLKLKAGMSADHWSAGFTAQRFEAVEVK